MKLISRLKISKRQRFIITSIALSLGFIGIQFLDERFRMLGIASLGVASLILFFWSLKEGMGFNMTLVTLILPFFYTIGVGLFWFLIPSSIYARIPVVILFGFGIYALCLTANIFTVSAIRTIALLRAARGVGFVLTLVTIFLIFDAILSLRAGILINSLLIFFSSLPIFFQGFWTVILSREFRFNSLFFSLVSSLAIGEIAISLFFWPVTVVVGSLFLTVAAYVLLGLGQAEIDSRLFKQTAREYLTVGLLVFIGMFLATRWGG